MTDSVDFTRVIEGMKVANEVEHRILSGGATSSPDLSPKINPFRCARPESTRDLQAEWDWQGPAQLEPESQVLVEPQFPDSHPHDAHRWASGFPGLRLPVGEADFVDAAVSDLPAEVDLAALPRWMRAAPEHGPPEELEFEAGSGPANDRE